MADTEQSRRRVQSIEVGFRVLRVLRMADGALPLREIAARAAMPPSKVHLYLVSFVREGMAYQDVQNGYYGLGPFAIQLGLAAIGQLDEAARFYMAARGIDPDTARRLLIRAFLADALAALDNEGERERLFGAALAVLEQVE